MVTNIQKNSVDLEWKPPKDTGGLPILEYTVEKKEKYGTWMHVGNVDGNTTKMHVPRLNENTEYFFRVIAFNKIGKSPPLETDAVTPKSPFSKFLKINFSFFLKIS